MCGVNQVKCIAGDSDWAAYAISTVGRWWDQTRCQATQHVLSTFYCCNPAVWVPCSSKRLLRDLALGFQLASGALNCVQALPGFSSGFAVHEMITEYCSELLIPKPALLVLYVRGTSSSSIAEHGRTAVKAAAAAWIRPISTDRACIDGQTASTVWAIPHTALQPRPAQSMSAALLVLVQM